MVENKFDFVYKDTVEFIDCIIKDYDFYGDLIDRIKSGKIEIALNKKKLKKNIDETWVDVIESSLVSLDKCIRSPMRDIKEVEQVLPIELSRNINAKSIRHLAQHTDYISSIDGDTITPSKILNVYKDENLETYENKFINTLIDRLFIFIERRYSKLLQYGQDEDSTVMKLESKVESDKTEATIQLIIDVKDKKSVETKTDDDAKSLWARVQSLRSIVLGYTNSEFCKNLNGKFVRPPIMRTNAITKNKDLKKCLELWQFIEGYDKIGYEIDINETAKEPKDEYINQLYSLLALQYVIFKFNTSGELEDEKTLESVQTQKPFAPAIIADIQEYEADEFNLYDVQSQKIVHVGHGSSVRKKLTQEEQQIRKAVEVALSVDKKIKEIERQRLLEEQRRLEQEQRRLEEERLKKEREEEARRLEQARLRLEQQEKERELERLRLEKLEYERIRAQREREIEEIENNRKKHTFKRKPKSRNK